MSSDDEPTLTGVRTPSPAPSGGSRFAPGVVLGGRYRIVGLLGRGGMGEVYRADDLTLDHPVALKFLPPELSHDPTRYTRFLNEVRVARQVTHANVCRVHDIGEAEGQHFLSMEYVDGEDLASLLRRIGRLPTDKGVQIARQICYGLAAAHERGVLHRDLKPANVMIDGRGNARLTDFGLAVLAGESTQGEVAGTPAYMAPEQASGALVTTRSDIYALGLILYEIFTGQPAFRSSSAAEIARLHRDSAPVAPRALTEDLAPSLERVILRCLEKNPERRPASAVLVAAALPGGDPLAAMLAAGETPSPELVAAVGGDEALRPAVALGLLLVLMVGVPVVTAIVEPRLLFRQVALDKPPEVLADRARSLAADLAGATVVDSTPRGFEYDEGLVDHLPAAAGRQPATTGLPIVLFWHRQGPSPLRMLNDYGYVTPQDPPVDRPGMVLLWLDTRARLVRLRAFPPSGEPKEQASEAVFARALAAAGLENAGFQQIEPTFVPPMPSTQRRSWRGVHPGPPAAPMRIDAATFDGRLTYFHVGLEESAVEEQSGRSARALAWIFPVLQVVTILGAGLLARRNLRLGRGDRRGALRLAIFAFGVRFLAWTLRAADAGLSGFQGDLVLQALGRCLYSAGLSWLLYIGIEPTVRRRWPEALVSWTRVLAGRFRDPRVGRDVLAGALCALTMSLAWVFSRLLAERWGAAAPPPVLVNIGFLRGTRALLSWMLLTSLNAVLGCLIFAVLFVMLWKLMGRAAVAMIATTAMLTLASFAQGQLIVIDIAPLVIATALMLATLQRFGFLSLVVLTFLLGAGRLAIPLTLDLGTWYAQPTVVWFCIWAAIGVYGSVVSMGGRPLLSEAD